VKHACCDACIKGLLVSRIVVLRLTSKFLIRSASASRIWQQKCMQKRIKRKPPVAAKKVMMSS